MGLLEDPSTPYSLRIFSHYVVLGEKSSEKSDEKRMEFVGGPASSILPLFYKKD